MIVCFSLTKISDAIKPLLETSPDSYGKNQLFVNESFPKATNDEAISDDCSITSINVETAQRDFIALQYALFVALFIQVLLAADYYPITHDKKVYYCTFVFQVIGAFAFIITSWVIIDDKEVVDRASREPGD